MNRVVPVLCSRTGNFVEDEFGLPEHVGVRALDVEIQMLLFLFGHVVVDCDDQLDVAVALLGDRDEKVIKICAEILPGLNIDKDAKCFLMEQGLLIDLLLILLLDVEPLDDQELHVEVVLDKVVGDVDIALLEVVPQLGHILNIGRSGLHLLDVLGDDLLLLGGVGLGFQGLQVVVLGFSRLLHDLLVCQLEI